MSERLTQLTANEQKPAKPNSEGGNNNAAPRTIGYNAGNSADCDDGQPNYCRSDFVHGKNSSTAKALPHVVTALVAKRAELAGQIEHLQGQVKHLTTALDHVEETLRLLAPDIDIADRCYYWATKTLRDSERYARAAVRRRLTDAAIVQLSGFGNSIKKA